MLAMDGNFGVQAGEETLAALLKRAGYKTGVLGKWHLGAHPTQHPNQKGFDEFFGFLETMFIFVLS